jgi:hypothetical protein
MPQATLWDKFVIDTSSLVELLAEDDPDAAWELVLSLVHQDRLKSVRAVMDELRGRMVPAGKFRKQWLRTLSEHRALLLLPDHDIITQSAAINLRYPALAKPFGPYERADPWVIGAAATFGYTVATEERDTNPGKKKRMPWVCDQERVQWCRLKTLLNEHGQR